MGGCEKHLWLVLLAVMHCVVLGGEKRAALTAAPRVGVGLVHRAPLSAIVVVPRARLGL